MLEQVGPEVVHEVDEQPLDVGAVLVLVGHDHDLAVAQRANRVRIVVLLTELQTHDLDDVVDLRVVHDLTKHRTSWCLKDTLLSWLFVIIDFRVVHYLTTHRTRWRLKDTLLSWLFVIIDFRVVHYLTKHTSQDGV